MTAEEKGKLGLNDESDEEWTTSESEASNEAEEDSTEEITQIDPKEGANVMPAVRPKPRRQPEGYAPIQLAVCSDISSLAGEVDDEFNEEDTHAYLMRARKLPSGHLSLTKGDDVEMADEADRSSSSEEAEDVDIDVD
jgi:hypothetical protein